MYEPETGNWSEKPTRTFAEAKLLFINENFLLTFFPALTAPNEIIASSVSLSSTFFKKMDGLRKKKGKR